jgi:hypothetical protein
MHVARYEVREGVTVAVFRLASPVLEFGWDGEERWVEETVFDRPSLEARLRNFQQSHKAAPATTAALAGWPQAETGGTATTDVAAKSISAQQRAAAVMRVLRGEAVETVARSLRVSEATVTAWRDAFLSAGQSALGS